MTQEVAVTVSVKAHVTTLLGLVDEVESTTPRSDTGVVFDERVTSNSRSVVAKAADVNEGTAEETSADVSAEETSTVVSDSS